MKKEFFTGYLSNKAKHDTEIPDGVQQRTEYERMLPTYVNEWARIVREQQAVVTNLIVDRDAKYGELLKHYRFEDQYTWGDTQLKSQIQNDPAYIKICRDIAEQQYYYDYAKDILDTIKGNHFIVQEYNKMKKESTGAL
jgi:hypothetical protein